MARPDFLGLDFLALQTLCLVHEKRSFTRAAQMLGVNQSAVSYTVAKLRRAFDDPLFFRQGTTLMATERCEAIVGEAARLLASFEKLTQPEDFEFRTASRSFVISCNYYERVVILPSLVRRIRAVAPNVRLETITSTAQGITQLQNGEAELLIGPLRPEGEDFYCRTLLDERYVCVMDAGNPLGQTPGMSVEDYLSARHVVVSYGGNWRSPYLLEMDERGLEMRPMLTVSSPAGLRDMLQGSDLVATLPSRVAARIGKALRVVACPIPAPFQIDLVWTTRTHFHPAHVWLRGVLSDIAGGLR
ncbi:DNA-binding transcriptional LysR family regulator [Primorskyibacter sedentarius]|uniref:DNA-binding transcriptional LysR family regulator n=2 Tax=Primorskyibacter sedentarius TaxID=745311 RepID=A0A4R3J560_9RHOB|nr:LysR family transcriptional regulator [Primorskyibacter sedentarius]TCS59056.1 DNA-binding transcriptional LysR family regulator [Primorskyibacter sedentarius]